RRRPTIFSRDWSSDVCSSDLDHSFGEVRAIVIAGHHRAVPPDHLADLALRQLFARLIDDAKIDAHARGADGGELVRMIVAGENGADAALGEAIVLEHLARPAIEDLPLHPFAKRRARAEFHFKGA